MIRFIIKREILEYLKSAKFLIGLGMTALLLVMSTVINTHDYIRRHQDYLDAGKDYAANLEIHYQKAVIFRRPQALSILVQGKDRLIGNRLEFNSLQEDVPLLPSGYLDDNERMHFRLISGFQSIDFSFIVRVLMSLMIIFLTYDSISGEKLRGTLRLTLANSLPRSTLLAGKFAASFAVVSGFFLFSSGMVLLILLADRSITLSGDDGLRLLGIMGLSFLYLIFFLALSFLVSVAVDRPALALMLLLQLWIFLVILYPNLGIGLAGTFYPLPEEKELVQLKDDMVKELRTEKQRLLAENSNAEGSRSEKDKSKETLRDRIAKLTMEITDKRLSVDKEYRHKLADQSHLAQALTILSPAVLYDTAACRLARTGINEFDRFMDGAYRLKQGYDDVMIKLMEGRMQQAPEFSYVAEPTAQSYRGVAYSWLFLILMSLIFLSLARTFFIHKDVR